VFRCTFSNSFKVDGFEVSDLKFSVSNLSTCYLDFGGLLGQGPGYFQASESRAISCGFRIGPVRSLKPHPYPPALLQSLFFQLFGCWISKPHILQVSTLNAGTNRTRLSEILVRLPHGNHISFYLYSCVCNLTMSIRWS